ncbi:hypothetical protein B7486_58775, partial [cyanobacterium TDX16]
HVPAVTVTTDGSQLGRRVRRRLGAIPCSIVVSMEGATSELHEGRRMLPEPAPIDAEREVQHLRMEHERGTLRLVVLPQRSVDGELEHLHVPVQLA